MYLKETNLAPLLLLVSRLTTLFYLLSDYDLALVETQEFLIPISQ